MSETVDSDRVFARLGKPPCNCEFEVMACDRCGKQYLIDHESLRVYADAADLCRWFLCAEGYAPACPGCERREWELVSIREFAPEWQWVRA